MNTDESADHESAKKKKKRLRPKLKPISSPDEIGNATSGDELLGDFMPATRNNKGNDPAAVSDEGKGAKSNPSTPPKPKRKHVGSLSKLQPRSTPVPPTNGVPPTPDDDDFDAFGFGLVKTGHTPPGSVGALTSEDSPGRTKDLSPISLRRAFSSDSYISDDSSSSDESAMCQTQRGLVGEHVYVNKMGEINRQSSSQATSEQRRLSSGSLSASALETGTQTTTDSRVHMLRSGRISNNASFSSSSSDGEPSYFNSQSYHSYGQDPQNVSLTSPPTQLLGPELQMRSTHATIPPPLQSTTRNEMELKLTLSEEDSWSSGRRYRVFSADSQSDRESPARQSTTPYSSASSVGDELAAYKLTRRGLVESEKSGRHAPSHNTIDTPTPVQSFYATPQSAMVAASTQPAEKPHAHHDSPFLANLRNDFGSASSVASAAGSFVQGVHSSPHGAFGEPNAVIMSPQDLSVKSPDAQTSQSNLVSLAYSDEEDNGRKSKRRTKASCFGGRDARDVPNGSSTSKYSSRWIVLLCVSSLIVLGDWTCFSVAPISMLMSETLDIDPELFVVLFLAGSIVGTTLEPSILGWLGLRRTLLLGSLLLTIANLVKSGSASWLEQCFGKQMTLYAAFSIAGLSQPLYQCTVSFLVKAWFPERGGSFATGVTLNSKMFGAGCAFAFGTLLVRMSEDVNGYFHTLAVISSMLFISVTLLLEEAPPTPQSDTIFQGALERAITRSNSPPKSQRTQSLMTRQKNHWNGVGSGTSNTPLLPTTESYGSTEPSSVVDEPDLAMENIVASVRTPVGGGSTVLYGSTESPHHAYINGNAPNATPTPSEDVLSPFPNLKTADSVSPQDIAYLPGLEYFHSGQHFRPQDYLPPDDNDGAEPIMLQTPRHFDIVRPGRFWSSLHACFARKGFAQCALAFSASGIIANTLSTFMAHLITLNGAGQQFVGLIGGGFQLLLIISSSFVRGRWASGISQRRYISILALLALGTLALALCSANLDADTSLWSNILLVAIFLGTLQPLSTELGAEVAYPLSVNTVLTIQQLLSNLLSAACILVFKELRDITVSVPDFTYSFYLLVLVNALATIYFAFFDARNLCQEAEGRRKDQRMQTKPSIRAGSRIWPRPKPPRDQPWGKKYPFLVPSSSI